MSLADASVLVVDDNEDNRYTLTRRLKREGYTNLATANDGRQAMALLRERPFDLMLLDIMMPEMDGYQVLEQVKADPALRDIPVIMISALEEVESVIRCVELGAEDYLAKPFNPTLLRARVGASLEKKRLRDEVRASLNRIEQELDTARALQLGMLPTAFPKWSAKQPLLVYATMEPAREVGGDLYDFFYVGEHSFCFLVGDVSGKGAPAAMFMARTRSLVRLAVMLWRRLAALDPTPGQIADIVNQELCQDNRERMFVTLFFGLFDTRTGELTYINAGHTPPYILRADGIECVQDRPDAPLGIRASIVHRNRTITLRAGDALFLATDGVVEAMNEAGEFYTDDRLLDDLRAACKAMPADIVAMVKERVGAFSAGAPQADDITMMALRWQPVSADGARESEVHDMASPDKGVSPRPEHGTATQLTIRNDIAELARLSALLDGFGEEHRIAPEPIIQLQVVLDELVSNVVKYAWPEGGDHEIQVRFTLNRDEVRIEIIDDGRMFNPLHAPAPEKPAPGVRPRPGNVGIHMVRKLVDHMEFARVGERNHLIVTKRCATAAAQK